MIYCFDLDGTLCHQREDGEYQHAKPMMDRIEHVNALHDAGHEIIIATARGAETGIDWFYETAWQLDRWGLRYDRLEVGDKPFAHAYVDDRAIHCDDFFGGD